MLPSSAVWFMFTLILFVSLFSVAMYLFMSGIWLVGHIMIMVTSPFVKLIKKGSS